MDPGVRNVDSATAFRSVTFSGAVSPNVDLTPNSETMKHKSYLAIMRKILVLSPILFLLNLLMQQTFGEFHRLQADFKPVITSVRGYSLRSGSSSSHTQQGAASPTSTIQDDAAFASDGEPVPKKAQNQCPSTSGPSPERLLAHANALINKVSSFVTKLVNAKYSNKGVATTQRNVKTSSVDTDLPRPVGTEVTTTYDKPAHTI